MDRLCGIRWSPKTQRMMEEFAILLCTMVVKCTKHVIWECQRFSLTCRVVLVAALSRSVDGSQIQLWRSVFLFSQLTQTQSLVKTFPSLTHKVSVPGKSAGPTEFWGWDSKYYRKKQRRKKRKMKKALGVENAGGVSLTCGMFSKLLYGTSFSTWKKK